LERYSTDGYEGSILRVRDRYFLHCLAAGRHRYGPACQQHTASSDDDGCWRCHDPHSWHEVDLSLDHQRSEPRQCPLSRWSIRHTGCPSPPPPHLYCGWGGVGCFGAWGCWSVWGPVVFNNVNNDGSYLSGGAQVSTPFFS